MTRSPTFPFSHLRKGFQGEIGLPVLFGVVPGTIRKVGELMDIGECKAISPRTSQRLNANATCFDILNDMVETSGHVASSILGAVTLYVLPCLYGYIGAVAATLRLLRRQVDGLLLSYTDKGV